MISRLILSVLFLFSVLWQVQAQNPDVRSRDSEAEVAALAVADYALIDRLMLTVPGVAVDARAKVTVQSVKPYMMPVRRSDNDYLMASYILASCLEYYVNLEKNYKVNLSPDFIALNLQAQGNELTMTDAFQFLADEGTVSAAIMPYGAARITNAVYATPKFQILHYLHVLRPVTRPRQKVFELRKALLRGNPVLVEIEAGIDLPGAEGQTSWQPGRSSSGQSYPLLVVGFDEDKEAFEVMSAWGSRWGKGGYLWVDYEVMSASAKNGYVLVPK